MEGMTTKFDIWENKRCLVNFQASAQALQVYQMFSGDGGKIHNSGDNNSDAGAGDGVVEHMIIPI
jgi:hypothetical protein